METESKIVEPRLTEPGSGLTELGNTNPAYNALHECRSEILEYADSRIECGQALLPTV